MQVLGYIYLHQYNSKTGKAAEFSKSVYTEEEDGLSSPKPVYFPWMLHNYPLVT